jgi:hypothetical protein
VTTLRLRDMLRAVANNTPTFVINLSKTHRLGAAMLVWVKGDFFSDEIDVADGFHVWLLSGPAA